MKICTLCKVSKDESEFWKDRYAVLGLSPRCKSCRRSTRSLNHHKLREKRENAKTRTEKKCSKCSIVKSLNEFDIAHSSLDGRASSCKTCSRISSKKWYVNGGKEKGREWYKKNKLKVSSSFRSKRDAAKLEFIGLLGGSCSVCGVTPSDDFPVACFDFHHRGKGKEMNISKVSRLVTPYNNEAIFIELAKCVVLCANCHRSHHYFNRR